MRREQCRPHRQCAEPWGSPPLARGTDEAAEGGSKDAGITPACAGNSASIYAQILHARDHPRLRGEQLSSAFSFLVILGSPPLARGTGEPRRTYCRGSGITPACAGNSCIISVSATAARDHPRLRGEQKSSATKSSGSAGSPPLARGTGIISSFSFSFARITPACAGNSESARDGQIAAEDHPRLRGEQLLPQPLPQNGEGSPPLARGTEMLSKTLYATARITPACAGNSKRFFCVNHRIWDHPRLRGEQFLRPLTLFGPKGSPPLARGTVVIVLSSVQKNGITPACAGNR